MDNHAILNLNTRAGDSLLALGGLRDQVVTKKHTINRCGTPGVRTIYLVHVGVSGKGVNLPRAEVETDG